MIENGVGVAVPVPEPLLLFTGRSERGGEEAEMIKRSGEGLRDK